MVLYIIYDYKNIYPELSGTALTDALIRECLGRKDMVIERTDKGKPYVRSPEGVSDEGRICISVSHSKGTFALLVSDENAGLDIQYARNMDIQKIAGRFFDAEEVEYVKADDSADSFFRLWTRKEALCKYTGMGMEQIMRKDQVLSREDVSFTDLRLEDGCYCAVCGCAKEGEKNDEIQISYRK